MPSWSNRTWIDALGIKLACVSDIGKTKRKEKNKRAVWAEASEQSLLSYECVEIVFYSRVCQLLPPFCVISQQPLCSLLVLLLSQILWKIHKNCATQLSLKNKRKREWIRQKMLGNTRDENVHLIVFFSSNLLPWNLLELLIGTNPPAQGCYTIKHWKNNNSMLFASYIAD